MDIKKAVITAAGKNQRTLPLQSLVDRDGTPRTALTILIEEVLQAGGENICVVISPGDESAYRAAAGPHTDRVRFIEQKDPLGYGHAVHCARSFTDGEPFLLLVGDHLYVSRAAENCAQQLVAIARAERCAVSAVQATHESNLPFYGTIGGRLVPGRKGLYQVESMIEKPTPTQAEQELIVPGLRAGHYLCFFGIHVLSPLVMELLDRQLKDDHTPRPLSLTPALRALAGRERYLASELSGRRYDIGAQYGLWLAQLALAMSGRDREEILARLTDMLAQHALDHSPRP
ncbi:MAG TPA: sugar phosphate nucleotidyltransferase [Methylomirabilota bacterium]|nr:sugar phosphate nucleotidyltransferase [Methylomirabilota bacterium]